MARSNPTPPGPNNDPLKQGLVILLMIILLCVITWRTHKNTFRRTVIDVVAAEHVAQGYLSFTDKAKKQHALNVKGLEYIKNRRFSKLQFGDLIDILSITGRFWLYGSTAILLWIAFVTWKRSLRHRYKRKMNFESLLDEQAKNFACVRPFLKINPLKESTTEGPWRYAEDYRTFALRNRLLLDGRRQPLPKDDRESEAVHYDFERASKVFAVQLGAPFTSYQQLPPHQKAILAIHLAHMMVDRDASTALADRCSTSFVQGKKGKPSVIDIEGADEIFAKHCNAPEFVRLCARHHHINVLLTAIRHAALDNAGVLQPAEFLWLRPVDRTLWYSMHQVKMREAHSEAAGVRAHYLAEKLAGIALSQAVVKQAAMQLRQALSDEGSISLDSDDFRPPTDDADAGLQMSGR